MFYVLAAYYARGRFLSAVRQSAPSGTSHRGVPRPGLRLLVTGSIHYTIKIASAVSRRRRKSKIVHAQRPDQIPPRAFHASLSLSRGRGEPREKQSTPIDIPSPSPPRHSRGLHRHSRAGGNPEKNKARRLTSPSPSPPSPTLTPPVTVNSRNILAKRRSPTTFRVNFHDPHSANPTRCPR